jgi:circadian clock protein KaiC
MGDNVPIEGCDPVRMLKPMVLGNAGLERLPTGIDELDLVLGGGLPGGSLVMVAGAPGTGKTILAQQICFAAATPERKAVYYTTLSEPHAKLIRHLEPFDFFDRGALGDRVAFIDLENLLVAPGRHGGNGLAAVVDEVVRNCFATQPAVIAIDSARALRDFVDERLLRGAVHELAACTALTGAVLLLVGEYTEPELESWVEFAVADGIIELACDQQGPAARRWLRVRKLRGADHLHGRQSLVIGRNGIEVFPRLESIVPDELPATDHDQISSGILDLDEMLGGGLPRKGATAVYGPDGCGKTLTALQFTLEGLTNDEKCLFVAFRETAVELIRKARSFGWDLAPAHASGQLTIPHVRPARVNLDALANAVQRTLAHGGIRRVAIDGLAEIVLAAGETERFPAYAEALTSLTRAAGASLIVTNGTNAVDPLLEPAGGLASPFDNVILLRYVERAAELRRTVTVLKMRDSDHTNAITPFEITGQGIKLRHEPDA